MLFGLCAALAEKPDSHSGSVVWGLWSSIKLPLRRKSGRGADTLLRSRSAPWPRGQDQEHRCPRPSPTPSWRGSAGPSHRLAGGRSTFLLKMSDFLGLDTSAQDTTSPPQSAQRTERERVSTEKAGGMWPQPQQGGASLA